ncbi:MAG: phage protein Gp36 family protein [Sphingomonas sp.]
MYATADDMRARFDEATLVQLTNTPSWGEACEAAIGVKLQRASIIIDGFVAKYYAPAPGIGTPPLLTEIECDIAYADLHKVPTDDAKDRRAAAMKLLEKIATGLIKLDNGEAVLPSRQGAVIVPATERTFSRDRLGGF